MLELKNKTNITYYRCTYLYIVNAVIFKLVLTSHLKCDLAKNNNNNNITTVICLAISVRAKILLNSLVQYSRGLHLYGNIDKLAALARGGAVLKRRLSCSPITTHCNTFSFSGGGPSSNSKLTESFVSGRRERYCNNVNNVKKNTIFEPLNMRACSSTPPK